LFSAPNKLTLPPDTIYEVPFGVRIQGARYNCLTVQLSNACWRQIDRGASETPYTHNDRFTINLNKGGAIFQYAYPSNAKNGSFNLSNAVMRLEEPQTGGSQLISLDEGLFDFISPNGKIYESGYIYYGSSGENLSRLDFEVKKDATFRCGNFLDYGSCNTNVFRFLSGNNYMNKLMIRQTLSGDVENQECRSRYIVSGDGALLEVGGFETYQSTDKHSYAIDVSSNGVLRVSSSTGISQTKGMTSPFNIFDGGRMEVSYTGTVKWTNPYLIITNATFDSSIKSTSVMTFNGGSVRILGGGKFLASKVTMQGDGAILTVDGASAEMKSLMVADNASARTEFRVDAGNVTVTDSEVVLVGANDAKGSLVLNGGVLEVKGIKGGAYCAGQDPTKTGIGNFKADGGTVRARAEGSSFIYGLSAAELGTRGLTIESDYDITIPQSFTNIEGEKGVLVLAGSGRKTLSGKASDVSKIVVSEGTVVFAEGARATSELVVINGARVEFEEDPALVGFTGLKLGDDTSSGVLVFAPDKTLAVGGRIDLVHPIVILDGAFSSGSAYTLMTTSESVSESTEEKWGNVIIAEGVNAAGSYKFSVSKGETSAAFMMSVSDFEKLEYSDGYQEISTDLSYGLNESLLVAVSNGASLAISGTIEGGALYKVGGGSLTIENSGNYFLRGISSEGGLFSVAGVPSLGFALSSIGGFTLLGGTFEYKGPSGAYAGLFAVDSPVASKAVVIKTDSPLTLSNVIVKSGCIVKRGTAQLTIDPGPNTETVLSVNEGLATPFPANGVISFDDEGTAPNAGYNGFTVIEGNVTLKGDQTTVIKIPNTVSIGGRSTQIVEQASMTIDGVKATLGNAASSWVHVCPRNSFAEDKCTSPSLTIRNGAVVECGNFTIGSGVNYPAYSYPTVTVDRATLKINQFMPGYSSYCRGRVFLSSAKLFANFISIHGVSYIDAVDTVIALNPEFETLKSVVFNQSGEGGEWIFRQGTRLYMAKLKNCTSGLKFKFDGATWETGGGEYPTFKLYRSAYMTIETFGEGGLTLPVAENCTVEVEKAITGNGPLIKTGSGVLVFGAAGDYDETQTQKTDVADSVTLAFGGALDVRRGSVSVAKGACRESGSYIAAEGASVEFNGNTLTKGSFAGAGTFSGATLSDATIVCPLDDDGRITCAPEFKDVTFTGKTVVDFGRVENSMPLHNITVELFKVPQGVDVSKWRVRNAGDRKRGILTVSENGIVTAEILSAGMMLIIR
jgi:hypothetical protein